MNYFFKALIALFIGLSSITAQELEKTWQFEAVANTSGNSLFNVTKFVTDFSIFARIRHH
jgi:CNT family concentrative nucleoside transporter